MFASNKEGNIFGSGKARGPFESTEQRKRREDRLLDSSSALAQQAVASVSREQEGANGPELETNTNGQQTSLTDTVVVPQQTIEQDLASNSGVV